MGEPAKTSTTSNTTTTTNSNTNSNNTTITTASVRNELDSAVKSFEQNIRRAVVKVDKYLRKGAPAEAASVEVKLEDFKQSVVLFNSGCRSMLLAAKQTVEKLDQCSSSNNNNNNNNNNTFNSTAAVVIVDSNALEQKQKEEEELRKELEQKGKELEQQKEQREAAEAAVVKSHALLQEKEQLMAEKENIIINVQKQMEELQEILETTKMELEHQQSEAIIELREKTDLMTQLNTKEEKHEKELNKAHTQIQYLEERLSTLEKSRVREFALLERMSNDHEKDITMWQSKCTQALQELERVQVEKKEMIGRLVDENLRAQVQELMRECNRLREVNAKLRSESVDVNTTLIEKNQNNNNENENNVNENEEEDDNVNVSTIDPQKSVPIVNKRKMFVNPAVVSLLKEKKELSDQLSAVFEEKLIVEKELLFLRQRLAIMEQQQEGQECCYCCNCESLQTTPPSPIFNVNNGKMVIDGMNGETLMENHHHNNNNNNNLIGMTGRPRKKCDVAIQYDTPNIHTNNSSDCDNHNCVHSHHSNNIRIQELEACIKRLEEQLIHVVTTATQAIDEERLAVSQQYQQELSMRDRLHQSQLTAIRTEAAQQIQETQYTLESRYKYQLQQAAECLRAGEERVAAAEKKVLAMQIDNEQLRVRGKVLERALEDMHHTQVRRISQLSTMPTATSVDNHLNHPRSTSIINSVNSSNNGKRRDDNQQQEEKRREDLLHICPVNNSVNLGMKDCNNSGATSLKSRADLLLRLDDVIKQVHERLTALDDEMAGITQAYEAEYWERIRRVEHLRDILTTRNNNNSNNNNCDDMNNNGVEKKDSEDAAASVSALLEAQRLARRDITSYYKAAEEKREELVGVLERAINRRLKLIQE